MLGWGIELKTEAHTNMDMNKDTSPWKEKTPCLTATTECILILNHIWDVMICLSMSQWWYSITLRRIETSGLAPTCRKDHELLACQSWHQNHGERGLAWIDLWSAHACFKALSSYTGYSAKYLFPAWLPPLMTLNEGTSEVEQKHSWTMEAHQYFPAYSWGWLLTLLTISTSQGLEYFFKNLPPVPKSSVQISASGWHHKLVCWLARKGGDVPQRGHVMYPNIETKSDQQDF